MTVASAIRELRSTLQDTQQSFAARLGVATASVARWEIAQRHPAASLNQLQRLALEQRREDLAEVFGAALAAKGYAPVNADLLRMHSLLGELRAGCAQLLREEVPPAICREVLTKLVEDAQLLDAAYERFLATKGRAHA